MSADARNAQVTGSTIIVQVNALHHLTNPDGLKTTRFSLDAVKPDEAYPRPGRIGALPISNNSYTLWPLFYWLPRKRVKARIT
jgi:hypothetical protein